MSRIPKTMRAVVLTGNGGFDKLEYREDVPVPAPEKGEILIRVGACGLNNTDINTRTAWYSKTVSDGITQEGAQGGYATADTATASWTNNPLKFPLIQGADVCGRIVAVGAGVDPKRVGERVMIDPWLLGHGDWTESTNSDYFGSECDGGYADYTKVRQENVYPIRSALSDAELATFATSAITAEHLIWRTDLQPGEWVVIAGASGGVGTHAIQLCRLRGARVIGIAAQAKAGILQELGCDAVIDRNCADLEGEIRKCAGGLVDVAIDVVGGSMFMHLINALRQRGRYSSAGAISGPMVDFDLRQLIYKDLQLTGATIVPPGIFPRLLRLIETDRLRPVLAATYHLRNLVQAQQAFMSKKHVGNIVVLMD